VDNRFWLSLYDPNQGKFSNPQEVAAHGGQIPQADQVYGGALAVTMAASHFDHEPAGSDFDPAGAGFVLFIGIQFLGVSNPWLIAAAIVFLVLYEVFTGHPAFGPNNEIVKLFNGVGRTAEHAAHELGKLFGIR
jgi:hypothetical protein